jgi:hypothetical protein
MACDYTTALDNARSVLQQVYGGEAVHADAQVVRDLVGTLEPPAGDFIIARFAPQERKCTCRRPCCNGVVEDPAWAAAITNLMPLARRAAPEGHEAVTRALVRRYFGADGCSIVNIAKRWKVSRDTLSRRYQAVNAALRPQEHAVLGKLALWLQETGIVAKAVAVGNVEVRAGR